MSFHFRKRMTTAVPALAMLAALAASVALAHGETPSPKATDAGHGGHGDHGSSPHAAAPVEETPFGRAGDPRHVTRTVVVDMSDAMRFSPATLRVKRNATVRFVVRNRGQVLHEMVIGTPAALDEHAALMKKMPDMEHDEPFMTHVSPGRRGEIVWQFTQVGEFRFACLIPGHYEAGMVGKVVVE